MLLPQCTVYTFNCVLYALQCVWYIPIQWERLFVNNVLECNISILYRTTGSWPGVGDAWFLEENKAEKRFYPEFDINRTVPNYSKTGQLQCTVYNVQCACPVLMWVESRIGVILEPNLLNLSWTTYCLLLKFESPI